MAKKILLVEDEAKNRLLITDILKYHGYEVLEAQDGPKGLNLAKEQKPDLILLDIMMPGMDGLEVCRLLREDAATATIPVVMVTALYEEKVIAGAIERGADGYIVKPIDPDGLKETILHNLSLAQNGLLPSQLKYELKKLRQKTGQ